MAKARATHPDGGGKDGPGGPSPRRRRWITSSRLDAQPRYLSMMTVPDGGGGTGFSVITTSDSPT